MDWIVLGGPGFVVIGSINQQPGVWISADGREWDVHGLHTHDGDSITRLFAADGALVIAGNVGRDRPSAATRVSQDGVTWDRVADDLGLIGDVAAMVDLADSGILAVGGRWTAQPATRFRSPGHRAGPDSDSRSCDRCGRRNEIARMSRHTALAFGTASKRIGDGCAAPPSDER